MPAFIESGKAHSVPIVYLYLTLCLGLCALNGFWFSQMLKAALSRGKPPTNLADDMTEELTPSPTPDVDSGSKEEGEGTRRKAE